MNIVDDAKKEYFYRNTKSNKVRQFCGARQSH